MKRRRKKGTNKKKKDERVTKFSTATNVREWASERTCDNYPSIDNVYGFCMMYDVRCVTDTHHTWCLFLSLVACTRDTDTVCVCTNSFGKRKKSMPRRIVQYVEKKFATYSYESTYSIAARCTIYYRVVRYENDNNNDAHCCSLATHFDAGDGTKHKHRAKIKDTHFGLDGVFVCF